MERRGPEPAAFRVSTRIYAFAFACALLAFACALLAFAFACASTRGLLAFAFALGAFPDLVFSAQEEGQVHGDLPEHVQRDHHGVAKGEFVAAELDPGPQ